MSRGISTRNLATAAPTNAPSSNLSAPRRQSVQMSVPQGFGLARQSSKRMLTSTSTPNLERLAAVAKKEKSVEHHNR